MGKKPKISQIELMEGLAAVISDNKTLQEAIFEDGVHPFTGKFHVYEPEPKRRKIYTELPGQVLYDSDRKVIAEEIVRWGKFLPPKYASYHLTVEKAIPAANYWAAIAEVKLKKEHIKPVREVSEKGYCFHRLDFDAKPGPTPTYDALCKNIETNQEPMEAFLGATLCSAAKLQHYLWLYGQGRDGKGTILRLVKKFLGASFVAMVDDPKQQNQFTNSRLIGKRLGAFHDVQNPHYVTSGQFLSLCGDDAVWVEKKGQDGVTMEIDANFMLASNKLPAITNSEAHIRRAIIVNFVRTEKEEDPIFEQKLWEERAGILWKWKKAWEKAEAEHGIKFDKEYSRLLADENEADYAALFESLFTLDKSGTTTGIEFINALRTKNITQNQGIHGMKAYMERVHNIRRSREGAQKVVVYKGISLRKTLDDTPIF